MKKLIILLLSAFVFSCGPKCPNAAAPVFQAGELVKLKAMNYGRETVVTDIQLNHDNCKYEYIVTYYTMWGTRRRKIVSEVELEKIK